MTTRAGRVAVTVWPPTGELGEGADRLLGGVATAALWVMAKVVPAIVSVVVRAAPVFAATVNVTVPVPLPDAPAEIVTKVALLVAVHAHPVPAVTGTDPVPPAALNDEVVMAPAVTVHDGVVGVVLLLLFDEQATATSNRAVAAQRRRSENAMRASRG